MSTLPTPSSPPPTARPERLPARFSAVVPSYQRAAVLPRALESIRAQTRPPEEVVVVDDGSTDGTRELVEALGPPVRYVHQSNAGAAAARNHGARLASSPWLAFLDSDDAWEPDHLERMARAIEATDGEADLYFADLRYDPARGGQRMWEATGLHPGSPHELRREASDWVWMRVQPMMLQASVFARDTFLELGGLREDLPVREDTHLFLVYGCTRPVCAVEGVGTRMFDDGSGRLTAASPARLERYLRASLVLYGDLERRDLDLRREHRRELHRRLAHAELGVAAIEWRQGRRRRALGLGLAGLAHAPGYTLRRTLRIGMGPDA